MAEVNTLRKELKQLTELIQKLIIEFRAVKLEVEASYLDLMESVNVILGTCLESRRNK